MATESTDRNAQHHFSFEVVVADDGSELMGEIQAWLSLRRKTDQRPLAIDLIPFTRLDEGGVRHIIEVRGSSRVIRALDLEKVAEGLIRRVAPEVRYFMSNHAERMVKRS